MRYKWCNLYNVLPFYVTSIRQDWFRKQYIHMIIFKTYYLYLFIYFKVSTPSLSHMSNATLILRSTFHWQLFITGDSSKCYLPYICMLTHSQEWLCSDEQPCYLTEIYEMQLNMTCVCYYCFSFEHLRKPSLSEWSNVCRGVESLQM